MPFVKDALAGLLGRRTASFYRLNAAGIPVQLISDLNPSPTPDRVKFDMIDSESAPLDFSVTTNALQDFTSATSNVHQEPRQVEVTGTITSTNDLFAIGAVAGNVPGQPRRDLAVLANLEALAQRREPIMYSSPRGSLPKAFIANITPTWTPELGPNTIVSVTLIEARIVNPLNAKAQVPDIANSFTGNNALSAAGAQAGTPIETQSVTNGPAPGVAPQVIGA